MGRTEKEKAAGKKLLPPVMVPLLGVFILLFQRSLFVYLAMLAGAAFLHYLLYRGEIVVNAGHVFFFAFLVGWQGGMLEVVIFVLLAGVASEIMGGNVELKTFIAYPLMIIMISAFILLKPLSFVFAGAVLSVAYYGVMFLISQFIGEPLTERLLEVVLPLVLNLIYFLSFGGFIYSALSLLS